MTSAQEPRFFSEYLGPDIAWAQCEAAGLCIRIGSRAWVFGRLDYREKNCPWPRWARFNLTLGHKEHADEPRRWKLFAFGRHVFDFGGKR